MRTSLSALALGISLAFAGASAMADTGIVHQSGYDNDATITQAYNAGAGAYSIINQNGDSNTAKTRQTDNWNANSYITQNGYDNLANVRQYDTAFAESRIYQAGDSNTAQVHQFSSEDGLYSSVSQNGYDNLAQVSQTNAGCWGSGVQTAAITQAGSSNFARVSQR